MKNTIQNIAVFLIGLLTMFLIVISMSGERQEVRVSFEKEVDKAHIVKAVDEETKEMHESENKQRINPFLIFNPIYQ